METMDDTIPNPIATDDKPLVAEDKSITSPLEDPPVEDGRNGDLRRRLAGAIFGHALGDAIAQSTKLMPLAEERIEVVFPRIGESRGLAPNDWGYATDHMLLTMQSLTTGRPLSELLMEFGERDEPVVLRHVISAAGFAADSCGVANEIWEKSGRKLATSAAISRAVACGLTNDPVGSACAYTAITHADPRCREAAIAVAVMIGGLINGVPPADIMHKVMQLVTDPEIIECIRADKTVAELELDVRPDYIIRALSCAVYAMRIVTIASAKQLRPDIKKCAWAFAAARGHSDANTGLVCAIVGAYIGAGAIPEDLIDAMPRHAAIPLPFR